MLRALTTAGQGMIAQQLNVDVISNNLANVNTTGFKKDRLEFKDLIYETFNRANVLDGDGRPVNLQVGHGVKSMATVKNFATGNLEKTERPLDFALEGDGFFRVGLPNGEMGYTRDGSFKMSITEDGSMITTSDGNPILDQEGEPIILPDNANINDLVVSKFGDVSYLGRTFEFTMGKLDQSFLSSLQNPDNDPLNIFGLLPVEIQDRIDEGDFDVTQDLVDAINENVINDEDFLLDININVDEIEDSEILRLIEEKDNDEISFEDNQKLNLSLLKYFYPDGINKNLNDPEMISLNQSFSVVNFQNKYGLESIGSNYYRETEVSGPPVPDEEAIRRTAIIQNFLESSNVQIVEEMVDLITAQRAYETNSKAVQTADDMLSTANTLKR